MTGDIIINGKDEVPGGYLECNGDAVSRTTYAALYALIGDAYGAGDGSTTFNVPDLRGRGIIGLKSSDGSFDALGETGGAKSLSLSHSHTMPNHTHPSMTLNSMGGPSNTRTGDNNPNDSSVASSGHTHSISSSSNSNPNTLATGDALTSSISIMNRFLVCKYLIKT